MRALRALQPHAAITEQKVKSTCDLGNRSTYNVSLLAFQALQAAASAAFAAYYITATNPGVPVLASQAEHTIMNNSPIPDFS